MNFLLFTSTSDPSRITKQTHNFVSDDFLLFLVLLLLSRLRIDCFVFVLMLSILVGKVDVATIDVVACVFFDVHVAASSSVCRRAERLAPGSRSVYILVLCHVVASSHRIALSKHAQTDRRNRRVFRLRFTIFAPSFCFVVARRARARGNAEFRRDLRDPNEPSHVRIRQLARESDAIYQRVAQDFARFREIQETAEHINEQRNPLSKEDQAKVRVPLCAKAGRTAWVTRPHCVSWFDPLPPPPLLTVRHAGAVSESLQVVRRRQPAGVHFDAQV